MPFNGGVAGGEQNSASYPSVSCTSSRACVAVGAYSFSSSGPDPLVVRLVGNRWSPPEEFVKGYLAPDGYLGGVSCAASNLCVAVGTVYVGGSLSEGLAMRWNGRNWRMQKTANQTTPSGANFNAVSCASPAACTAVGAYGDAQDNQVPFAEGWNGAEWSIQPTIKTSGQYGQFNSVSCVEADECIAVGTASDTQVAQRWDGTRWTV